MKTDKRIYKLEHLTAINFCLDTFGVKILLTAINLKRQIQDYVTCQYGYINKL